MRDDAQFFLNTTPALSPSASNNLTDSKSIKMPAQRTIRTTRAVMPPRRSGTPRSSLATSSNPFGQATESAHSEAVSSSSSSLGVFPSDWEDEVDIFESNLYGADSDAVHNPEALKINEAIDQCIEFYQLKDPWGMVLKHQAALRLKDMVSPFFVLIAAGLPEYFLDDRKERILPRSHGSTSLPPCCAIVSSRTR